VKNGFEEDRALKLINNFEEEGNGQLAFQTALELRKISREDRDGEQASAFADEVDSIIKENGSIENSELKQLAAEYRKEARKEEREKMKVERENNSNSISDNSYDQEKENNAVGNGLNKDNKGKGNSEHSKTKAKEKDKSPNDNANQNAK
jgi:hypothetical protein